MHALLRRLRSNQMVRCKHHPLHYKHAFGKDAEALKDVVTCDYIGDLTSIEKHIQQDCLVQRRLNSGQQQQTPAACNNVTAPTTPAPGTAPARAARTARVTATAPAAGPGNRGEAAPRAPKQGWAQNNSAGGRSPAGKQNADNGVGLQETTVDNKQAELAQVEGSEDPEKEESPQKEDLVFRCNYDFEPQGENQLQLRVGDLLQIYQSLDAGWAAGRKVDKKTREPCGDAGWFPRGYLASVAS